jgi:hypothetical protein
VVSVADEDLGVAVGSGVVVSVWAALAIAALLRRRRAAGSSSGSQPASSGAPGGPGGAPGTSTSQGLCLTCPSEE